MNTKRWGIAAQKCRHPDHGGPHGGRECVEQLAELQLADSTFAAAVGLTARKVVRELKLMPLAAVWSAAMLFCG